MLFVFQCVAHNRCSVSICCMNAYIFMRFSQCVSSSAACYKINEMVCNCAHKAAAVGRWVVRQTTVITVFFSWLRNDWNALREGLSRPILLPFVPLFSLLMFGRDFLCHFWEECSEIPRLMRTFRQNIYQYFPVCLDQTDVEKEQYCCISPWWTA